MNRYLITGANSFIGSKLCKKLLSEGAYVYAVTRSPIDSETIANNRNLSNIICDMRECPLRIKEEVDEVEGVIMLAWDGTRGESRNDYERQKANVKYSLELAEVAVKTNTKFIMLAGSQAEYGINSTSKKVVEDDVANPNTEYGKAKLELYKALSVICNRERIRLIEPRFFSLYGPGDYEATMIQSMLKNMILGQPCNLTECTQMWDFMYIDDAIEGLYRLINSRNASGIFNFGSGESKPLYEYVNEMRALTKSSSIINFGAIAYPSTGIVHTNPSVEKLSNIVNYRATTTFTRGIEQIIASMPVDVMKDERE